jgi:condensin-2 complex subunit H2
VGLNLTFGDRPWCSPLLVVVYTHISFYSLEEYLQELALEHPQGLGGLANNNNSNSHDSFSSETPNFAQAALLLQNSSNVYSRKVEYLHGLVFKALDEFFRDNNPSNSQNNNRRKSADASIDEFQNFDPHTDFLLLDDILPEDHANKINLAPDHDDDNNDQDGTMNDLAQTPNQSQQSVNKTRLSLGGLSVTNILERTTVFRGSSPSQQRALLGTLNTGTLRLLDGRCDIGEDGVLLMPGSSQSPALASSSSVRGSSSGLGRLSLLTPLDKLPPSIQIYGASENNGPEPMQMDDDDEDHDNDGTGFDFGTDDNDHYEVPSAEDMQPVGLFRHAAAALTTDTKRVTFAKTNESKPVKKKADPWLLMDPHERQTDTKNHKPLRKGKTYRLPLGIDQPPSQCVTGARTRRLPKSRSPPLLSRLDDAPRTSLAASTFRQALQKHHGRHTQNKRIQEPTPLPLNGLVFSEFAYIAKATAKKRAAQRRALRKQQAMDQPNQYHDEDDDDYGGGYDLGGDDHDDDDDYEAGGNAGVASLEDAFTNNSDNQDFDNSQQQHQESNIGKTFEELCRAHIQAFAKGAEDYALNTQLTDRVSQWQAKLSPMLEEEEKRAEFDIHKYSSHVIEMAQQQVQNLKSKRKSDGFSTIQPVCCDVCIVCVPLFLFRISSHSLSRSFFSLDRQGVYRLCRCHPQLHAHRRLSIIPGLT